MDNRIERSIDIGAPLDRVWELVTEPGWWVPDDGDDGTGDVVVADRSPGAVTVRSSGKWGTYPVQVVELRPQTYASFRWASQFTGQDLAPGRTTLIEFSIAEIGGVVRVSVAESGFAALDAPDDVKRAGFSANSAGWEEELGALAKRASS